MSVHFPQMRVAGIILKDDEVLLMDRNNHGRKYFSFIGGGVEEGESYEDALYREIKEETSVEVQIEKLIYSLDYSQPFGGRTGQRVYLCRYISGVAQLGESEEKEDNEKGLNTFQPVWVSIAQLNHIAEVYPTQIKKWLIKDYPNNFINTPRTYMVEVRKGRLAENE